MNKQITHKQLKMCYSSLKITLYLAVLLTFGACSSHNQQAAAERFDELHPQTEILSYAQIDSILSSFPKVKYGELDPTYLAYSDSSQAFKKVLKDQTYYLIQKEDIYKYLIGKQRVTQFLSKDKYYIKQLNNPDENIAQYLLLDKKLLYRTLDLMLLLEKEDYNKYGFRIREGHRHPHHNFHRGGAKKSQHIRGKAVDIIVEDINRDGKADQADKTILLDLLDKHIIKNKGGIGRYPGTMVIHYDTRGSRSRWDSYTPHRELLGH